MCWLSLVLLLSFVSFTQYMKSSDQFSGVEPTTSSEKSSDQKCCQSLSSNRVSKARIEMSSADPGILCFQHCNPKSKVFCLELPDYCPQCDSPMSCVQLKIPPFCVPYPFTCAKRTQCSVIIRPTDGDFLQ